MNIFRQFHASLNFSRVVWRDITSEIFSNSYQNWIIKLGAARTNTGLIVTGAYFLSTAHMASVQVARAHSQVKPPNVLVLQPLKDSTSEDFGRIREALETCLTPERYVIYPLGIDEIRQHSPWQENCRLLLVPPPTERAQSVTTGKDTSISCSEPVPLLSDKVLQEIALYVSKGGVLLSMQPELNRMLGLDSLSEMQSDYCQHGVCSVAVKSDGSSKTEKSAPLDKFNALHISALASSLPEARKSHDCMNGVEQNSSCVSRGEQLQLEMGIVSKEDLAVLTAVETDAMLEWLDANTNQSNNVPSEPGFTATPQLRDSEEAVSSSSEENGVVCVQKLELEQGGKAVLSSVELFPLVPRDLGVKVLVWLKRGVEQRRKFLSSVLLSLGLECSEEKLPELTHTYLVCSSEVSESHTWYACVFLLCTCNDSFWGSDWVYQVHLLCYGSDLIVGSHNSLSVRGSTYNVTSCWTSNI